MTIRGLEVDFADFPTRIDLNSLDPLAYQIRTAEPFQNSVFLRLGLLDNIKEFVDMEEGFVIENLYQIDSMKFAAMSATLKIEIGQKILIEEVQRVAEVSRCERVEKRELASFVEHYPLKKGVRQVL